jgi:RHS repeat-associated protein
VTDQLGAVKDRKDHGAFGDETATAERVSGLGYNTADPTRQGYTGYEKDGESSLEFAQARYYSTTHGRYTSVDPLTASVSIKNPQTFNRYTYVLNSPYKYTDPLGLLPLGSRSCGQWCSNSGGGSVDGSAFRGRDTSMGANMLATITLEYNVDRALKRLSSADFNSQFTSNVTADERSAIKRSLQRMLNGGNVNARNLSAMLVNGGTTFDVGNINNSANVGVLNVSQLNGALKSQSFNPEYAFQFFQITLDRKSWQNTKKEWQDAFVASNLIHEGFHVHSAAYVLASWSAYPGREIDVGNYWDELGSKEAGTKYLISMGGEYVKYGQAIQYIEGNGRVNYSLLQSSAGTVSRGSISQWLKGDWGVVPRQ